MLFDRLEVHPLLDLLRWDQRGGKNSSFLPHADPIATSLLKHSSENQQEISRFVTFATFVKER